VTEEAPDTTAQRAPGIPDSPERPTLPSGPGAKARILATAARLFYYEGIRAVGIDRLISEASVTKATFYKHYGSKDTLILAYVSHVHDETVTILEEEIAASASASDALRRLFARIQHEVQAPGFRGCAFINAAIEFADGAHPVRQVVRDHRDWFSETLATLFRAAEHPMPGDAADEFMLLRDGTMTGAYAGDGIAAGSALTRFAERMLGAA